MRLRLLTREEVELIWTIDRSEVHHHIYELREGRLVRTPKYFEIAGWRPGAVEKETPLLLDCFDRGGIFLGVFDAEALIRVGVLESACVGRAGDKMQLAYLYVSRADRGRGVGTQLFDAAVSVAREAGANALYVSATPTQNTVDFYLNRGCALAPEPDPRLLVAEPDDIHLLYARSRGPDTRPSPRSGGNASGEGGEASCVRTRTPRACCQAGASALPTPRAPAHTTGPSTV